jgi:hypothetical protein
MYTVLIADHSGMPMWYVWFPTTRNLGWVLWLSLDLDTLTRLVFSVFVLSCKQRPCGRLNHTISFSALSPVMFIFSPHIAFTCSKCFSEQTAIISLNSMCTLVSITEAQAVIWEVGHKFLNIIESILVLPAWIALSRERGNSLWKLSSHHSSQYAFRSPSS